MSFVRYSLVIWMCLLVIVGIQAFQLASVAGMALEADRARTRFGIVFPSVKRFKSPQTSKNSVQNKFQLKAAEVVIELANYISQEPWDSSQVQNVLDYDLEPTIDGHKLLVYSVGSRIHWHSLWSGYDVEFSSRTALSRVGGIALSPDPERVYWSEIGIHDKKIMRRTTSSYDVVEEVIAETGLAAPEHLALDWVTGNLYFIDDAKKHIGVCTANGSYCTILLDNSTIDTPGDLVLNSKNSEMFWSDYGRNPQIWRAGMNGDNDARAVVNENLSSPKGLAIDYSTERLYWIDSELGTIESISIDGGKEDRQRLLKTKDKQLHSIAISDGKIFCNDWKSYTIESMVLATGENREILVTESRFINDMEIHDYSIKETLMNPCENHHCAELCLLGPGPNQYTCACKVGSVLNPDSHSCRPRDKLSHLVIAVGNKMIHYHDEPLGKPHIHVTPVSIYMNRIAYDRNTRSLIADDQFTNSLVSLSLVNNEIRRLTSLNSRYLGSIDFNDKSNVTTWSVTGLDRIDQMRLDDSTTTRYNIADSPQDIIRISNAQYGELWFVVFQDTMNTLNPSQYIARMDNGILGSSFSNGVSGLSGRSKISLAYDESSSRLYFADEKSGKIVLLYSYEYGTGEKKILCSGVENPVSLAIMNRKIFWTLRNSNILQSVDIDDENCDITSKVLPVETFEIITDIVVVENIAP